MATESGAAEPLGLWDVYREAANRGYLAEYRRRRWSRFAECRVWLAQEELAGLSWDQVLTLFRSSGASGIREIRTNPMEEVRDALDFLLYDTITLEIRFAECAAIGGSYHLPGLGKEFVSYLLCLRDPSLFGVWQSYVPRALRLMGKCPPNLGKGHLGLGYLDLLDALQGVRRETGLNDFRGVDEYCYAITRRYKPPI
jgi:hypothetical protein